MSKKMPQRKTHRDMSGEEMLDKFARQQKPKDWIVIEEAGDVDPKIWDKRDKKK